MKIKVKFADLAEEVLKASDEPLPVTVIIDRVTSLATTKPNSRGRKASNRYLKNVTHRAASSLFRVDKRFTKHAQEEWRVDLWTLAEE